MKKAPMPIRYQDIYPSSPLLSSDEIEHPSATPLMSVRYSRAEPESMPE